MGDVEKPDRHRMTSTETETGRMTPTLPRPRLSPAFTPHLAAAIVALTFAAPGTPARAEPLVTQGIGTSSCARLAADLNPNEGLSNPVNVMLYAWVQGYVSAANISLLENGGGHVDMSGLDEAKVLNLVVGYCKANPDKRPVTAIDDMIRKSAKTKAKWEAGTIEWDE
jgi:hypothetical protein